MTSQTRARAAIILAAGQGTRMRSATPKLLHPLAGSPIVAHVLRTANALDAAHVVAVVRHERDQVAAEVEAVMPGIIVVDHHEPYGNFSIEPPQFAAQFKGKNIRDPFKVGSDIDAVSRATISVTSASRSVRNSARRVARQLLTPEAAK